MTPSIFQRLCISLIWPIWDFDGRSVMHLSMVRTHPVLPSKAEGTEQSEMSHQQLNKSDSKSPPLSEAENQNGIKEHIVDVDRPAVNFNSQVMAADLASASNAGTMSEEYQKSLLELRQHQFDEQVLLANLQQQQQLQEHFKMFIKKQQEERNAAENHHMLIMEKQKIQQRNDLVNAVLNKDKSRESANASSAVKQVLQKFVIGRQKGKTFDNYTTNLIERGRELRWTPSLDSRNGVHDLAAPYPSLLYDKRNSFPLRKTASEPNLKVKSRTRKAMADRRCSPLLTPRHAVNRADIANRIKKKINSEQAADNSACNSAPNSGPNSPLSSNSNINNSSTTGGSSSHIVGHHLPAGGISESELPGYVFPLGLVGALSGRDLHASPSLPNISFSLGQKKSDVTPMITATPAGVMMYPEAELQRMALARTASLPGPLMHMYKLPSRLPDAMQQYTAHLLQQQQAALLAEKDSPPGPIRHTPQARPHKVLSRTHSAPTTTAQIQHQILQRKRLEQRPQYLQQPHKHAPHLYTGMAAEAYPYRPLATHREASEHGETSKHRSNKPVASPPPTHPSAISSSTAAALVSHLNSKHFHKPLEKKRNSNTSPSHTTMDHTTTMSVEKPSRSVIVAAPNLGRSSSSDQDSQDVIEVKREPRRTPERSPTDYSPSLVHKQMAAMAVKDKIGMSHDHLPTKPSPLQARRSLLEGEMGQHPPLTRTQSSPAVSFSQKAPHKAYKFTTGLAYDPIMLRHGCACGDAHAEHEGRLKHVWARLNEVCLVADCESIEPRKATMEELQLAHTQEHTLRYGATPLARQQSVLADKFIVLPCGGVGVDNGIDIDTVWNELDTINAARMAVGLTVDLALSVAADELKNGFAVVRPPGHHAQKNLAMAFCYFNSVAVAARQLQQTYPNKIRRILIVDWDVHHCNGTQDIFYDDASVLVISIHRFDEGNFFPGTGAPDETGAGGGVGFNVNIGFSGGLSPAITDADYLSAFRTVVMPIAEEFNPDFVFVSAGFSAATGHPSTLGGYKVSPQCFSYLTRTLSRLAKGKMVMALEGGFEIEALCNCVEICVRTLLTDTDDKQDEQNRDIGRLPNESLDATPCENAVRSINKISRIQERYWSRLKRMSAYASCSHSTYLGHEQEDRACVALASLSVEHNGKRLSGNMKLREAVHHMVAKRQGMDEEMHGSSVSKVEVEDVVNDEEEDNDDESKLTIVTDDVDEPTNQIRLRETMSAESSPLDVVGLSSSSESPAQSPARHPQYTSGTQGEGSMDGMAEKASNKEEEPMDQEESLPHDTRDS